jgi:hypothetical protein
MDPSVIFGTVGEWFGWGILGAIPGIVGDRWDWEQLVMEITAIPVCSQ